MSSRWRIFDSSWEVAYWIYCKEHGLHLERNKKKFLYEYNGKVYRYLPDFFDGSTYIEIKGREDDKCKAKYSAVDNLKVIYDVSKEIAYVKGKYGKYWLDIVCDEVYNKTDKEKRERDKRKIAEISGKINSAGSISYTMLDKSTWNDRKKRILRAISENNINVTKHGWKAMVSRSTGLTRSVVRDTVKHFKEEFKSYHKDIRRLSSVGRAISL